ncbi:MAG: hypothetical protein IJP80_08125 [Bacteroidales bacterium]|nr:hypothetical protein [Bacteroidales bacterium]
MRRYLLGLIVLTIVMMVLAFATKWCGMDFFAPLPSWLLPAAVLYFAVACGVQYWLTVSGMNKRPLAFIHFFLATTVAVLLLHIVVLVGGMLLNPAGGKRFAVAFLTLYVVYTVYMITQLVLYVRRVSKD